MSVWSWTYDEYSPAEEGLREALCTLGNGYMATRGAAPESAADGTHYPGTYMAGYFNRLTTTIEGKDVENESMVNMPNWLPVTFRIGGGQWFDLDCGAWEIIEFAQELEMKKGVLTRRVRVRDAERRTTSVTQRRFVHMGHRHLAGIETTLMAEDWSGAVEVRCAIDGVVENSGVPRYKDLDSVHLDPLEQGADGDISWVVAETSQSRVRVAVAQRVKVHAGEEPHAVDMTPALEPGRSALHFEIELAEGEPVTVEKVAAVFGSRDKAISEPLVEAIAHVERCRSFDELLTYHVLVWDHLWKRFGIYVATTDGERVATVLNLHMLHVLQTLSPNCVDMDVGVPARGLHGEAYRGHIFWDELFILPLLTYRFPALTRSMLLYRYRRLNEARRLAWDQGFAGALFPWQSGSNGREETQTWHLNPMSGEWIPDNSHLQRHVNIAIAYNVWHYFQVTGDLDFMDSYGAEMLIEIARFWASAATYNRALDRYEILGVMGPDEYHDAYPDAEMAGLNNNAYTNVMAAWVLCRARDALDALNPRRKDELRERLSLGREELELWEDVSRKLVVPFHDGVISQFDGYAELEEFDWDAYRSKYGDIHRLDRILNAEGDTPNRYKVSKQADVLMLFYLLSAEQIAEMFDRLGYEWSGETLERTVDYYMARTSHGSTLSRIVHAWVNARLDRAQSWEHFIDALESDVGDIQGGTTAEGIHLGAMAGTLDLIQTCYTGLEPRHGILWLDPGLPEDVDEMAMDICYRDMWITLRVTHETVTIMSDAEQAGVCQIGIGDELHPYEAGQTLEVTIA